MDFFDAAGLSDENGKKLSQIKSIYYAFCLTFKCMKTFNLCYIWKILCMSCLTFYKPKLKSSMDFQRETIQLFIHTFCVKVQYLALIQYGKSDKERTHIMALKRRCIDESYK